MLMITTKPSWANAANGELTSPGFAIQTGTKISKKQIEIAPPTKNCGMSRKRRRPIMKSVSPLEFNYSNYPTAGIFF